MSDGIVAGPSSLTCISITMLARTCLSMFWQSTPDALSIALAGMDFLPLLPHSP